MIFAVTDVSKYLCWETSRATGTAAMIFSSIAVCIGLSYKLIGERERAIRLGALHEVLGLATIVCVFVHGFILLGDTYISPTVKDILVPFAESYHRRAWGIGVVAGYLMVIFASLYYVRHQIGKSRFKLLHRVTLLAWLASVIHTLSMGTDTASAWYLIVLLPFIVAVPVALLARLRHEMETPALPAPAQSAVP
jgi:sulfoxide reductase heme-binding subunit YedZ